MAVYTKLTSKDISEHLAGYSVGTLTSAHPIAEGITNTNYLIKTSKGRYILTLFEQRTDPAELPFFMKLTEHLAGRGIPCPKPVVGKDKQTISVLKGKSAVLVEFLEGKGSPTVTDYHIRQLGELTALMHLAAADFRGKRANALSLSGWKKIHATIGGYCDKVIPGLDGIIKKELTFLEKNWPKNLPSGVVHADLFPDNVFFKNDQLTGVIDFYFACNDFWMYDLIICMNAWCFNGDWKFLPGRARVLLQAYHNIRPITREERAAIPVLARGAALRFLLTRTQDWLMHDPDALVTPKDPGEYLAKLRFHQGKNPLLPL